MNDTTVLLFFNRNFYYLEDGTELIIRVLVRWYLKVCVYYVELSESREAEINPNTMQKKWSN